MTLSELIIACGDESVKFQNLDHCAISLDWSRKAGGRITFGTEQPIIPGDGTEQLGLVVWLDRKAVADAIAREPRNPADTGADSPSEARAGNLPPDDLPETSRQVDGGEG